MVRDSNLTHLDIYSKLSAQFIRNLVFHSKYLLPHSIYQVFLYYLLVESFSIRSYSLKVQSSFIFALS